MSLKAMKRNLEENEVGTYLSQLGKVSVQQKRLIQIDKKEKHLQRESKVFKKSKKESKESKIMPYHYGHSPNKKKKNKKKKVKKSKRMKRR